MTTRFDSILIIADIEGSSGCWSYRASSFMTDEWARACVDMSLDVNAVVKALFDAGVKHVTVKDFHRTGYNLLPELINPRAQLVSGYRRGPVPGIGEPGDVKAVMFLGMHAASGTDGFLAHTLTSRLNRLDMNGNPLAEVVLFAASLAPYAVQPLFFSGCAVACAQAKAAITGIHTYPIDKSTGPETFDVDSWRSGLAKAAVESLNIEAVQPYEVEGPFKAVLEIRGDKDLARKIATRWGFAHEGSLICIEATDMHHLYGELIKLCYLTPFREKILPLALLLNNLKGRLGLHWVRRRVRGYAPVENL